MAAALVAEVYGAFSAGARPRAYPKNKAPLLNREEAPRKLKTSSLPVNHHLRISGIHLRLLAAKDIAEDPELQVEAF